MRVQVAILVASGLTILVAIVVLDRTLATGPFEASAGAAATPAQESPMPSQPAIAARSTEPSPPASPRRPASPPRPTAASAPTRSPGPATPPQPAAATSGGTAAAPPAPMDARSDHTDESGPNWIRQSVRSAQGAFDRGDFRTALSESKALIEQRPQTQDAYPIAVRAACALGDVETAKTYIDKIRPRSARSAMRDACAAAGTAVP